MENFSIEKRKIEQNVGVCKKCGSDKIYTFQLDKDFILLYCPKCENAEKVSVEEFNKRIKELNEEKTE